MKIATAHLFLKYFFAALSSFLISAFIFFFGRILILINYGAEKIWESNAVDIGSALQKGFLFDIKYASHLFAPIFIFSFILLIFPRTDKVLKPISHLFIRVILFLASLLSVVNYYYYHTYQSHIDTFAFGIIEDDFFAILKTAWKDLPLLWMIFGVFIVFYFAIVIYNKMTSKLLNSIAHIQLKGPLIHSSMILICLGIYFLSLRGSLGIFPLSQSFARVSSVKIINDVVPNGPIALFWAIKERAKEESFPSVSLQQGSQIYKEFFGKADDNFSLDSFFKNTPKDQFLEDSPPQVVVSFMEGLGSHPLNWQDDENDLLGSWKDSIEKDFFFTKFLSAGNGTFPSLLRVLLSSRFLSLPSSRAKHTEFKTSIARPYKEKGYKTVFITSGNASWRNLGSFLVKQGFDSIVDYNVIMKKYTEARPQDWGIFDEYTFKYAYDLLKESEKNREKIFIFILTITNHPPYDTPETYTPYPLTVTDDLMKRLNKSKDHSKKIMRALQYSNDALGKFILKVKSSTMGQNTILAATGDHNLREFIYKDQEEYALWRSTPFYIYVPSNYQKNLVYDPKRIGSHRDIFPTLYSLSLSNASYLALGQNILSDSFSNENSFGVNEALVINKDGGFNDHAGGLYYPWSSFDNFTLQAPVAIEGENKSFLKKVKAYRNAQDWLTLYQIHH